jgi:hypothetical protein
MLRTLQDGPALLWSKVRRSRRAMPLASSTPPQPHTPIQAELALDHVRVVRNDLSDTDYEVVCADTSTASPVKRVPAPVSLPTPSRPLARLAQRLFREKVS